MSPATAISLFAALGFGTIIAAVFTRWNAVSQLRQAWVDALRTEIAEFFLAVEKVGEAAFGDASVKGELRARRDHALFKYRQILLRLNLKEKAHRRLDRSLQALLVTGRNAEEKKLDTAMLAARRVLKAEWERTKYGPMTGIARRWKRCYRRWRLSKELMSLPRRY